MNTLMETIVPISDLQSHAKKIIERVKNTRDPVVITQRGRPAALLVNYEDYAGMVATLEEMSQPDWRERLVEAERDSQGWSEYRPRQIFGPIRPFGIATFLRESPPSQKQLRRIPKCHTRHSASI